jgi:hypothetical protein
MQAQAIGGAVSGFSHAALPPPLHMLQPPSRMRPDVLRFHGHLLWIRGAVSHRKNLLEDGVYWALTLIKQFRHTFAGIDRKSLFEGLKGSGRFAVHV